MCDVIRGRGPHRDPPNCMGQVGAGEVGSTWCSCPRGLGLATPTPAPSSVQKEGLPPWDLQTPPSPTPDGQGEGSGRAPWPPWSAVRHRPLQAAELSACLTPPIRDTDATSSPCSGIWQAGPAPGRRASRRDQPQGARTAQPVGDGASPGTSLRGTGFKLFP